MTKLDKPYRGPDGIFPQSYRDSRQAFKGSRFEVPKKHRDYLWTLGAILLGCVFIALWVASL